ncbi:ABC transporter substrate-binding protein [Ureibacillus massiliensis 4400831 = CIP 108448 = CCUG 49529]|uniref:ABC transporter substrate-binding protein n=2 Tax=cellular organisms TaxID=131567 RepID=A0A0A3J3Y8_9BACL|nr:ABC transporter substrate-binding protein [Ureibacillus massiliensis]KGR91739.1 ABC transporter substrate-binding protein [Ureibacillus massiliensis 4400831 = CIP 108448 = CCUG 49529]
MKKIIFTCLLFAVFLITACGNSEENANSIDVIKFADAGWDSIRVHNSIAQTIIEEGYGYETEVTNGTTAATMQALQQGDINVYMEVWTDNVKDIYEEMLEKGDIVTLATNFADNTQGLYVPTYVIEGDAERGIEPVAPDLKTVQDLEKYPQIFQDPEDSSKGRVIGAPSSWAVSEHLETKLETYGLDEYYNYLAPGSDAAIVAELAGAYQKGEPWVGYYWSPTWVTASYDLTLLEDNPYEAETWESTKGTEFPPNDVVISVHKDFPNQASEVAEFLSNYKSSNAATEEMLKYMGENELDPDETAEWWLKENEAIWTEWVPEEVAEKVKASLQ